MSSPCYFWQMGLILLSKVGLQSDGFPMIRHDEEDQSLHYLVL